MTKKHFEEAVKIIRCISNAGEKKRTVIRFSTLFKKFSPRFNELKFFEACWAKRVNPK
jgi:hypothetical protein